MTTYSGKTSGFLLSEAHTVVTFHTALICVIRGRSAESAAFKRPSGRPVSGKTRRPAAVIRAQFKLFFEKTENS